MCVSSCRFDVRLFVCCGVMLSASQMLARRLASCIHLLRCAHGAGCFVLGLRNGHTSETRARTQDALCLCFSALACRLCPCSLIFDRARGGPLCRASFPRGAGGKVAPPPLFRCCPYARPLCGVKLPA